METRKELEEEILKECTEADLTFPMYLSWEDGTIEVLGLITYSLDEFPNPDDYIEGKGYVLDGIVYQYHKEKPKRVVSPIPYFYITKSEHMTQLITKYPLTREETIRRFGIRKLVDYSYQRIVRETRGDEILYNEDMISDMTAARSKYVPDVKKDDDCLKKLVKYMILKKDVDINKYKSVMDTPYALTNMKSALISKTKMSITYFLMWVELLGVDFSIVINDNGRDYQDPLKESLLYRSKDNSVNSYDPKKFMVALTKKVEYAKQKELEESALLRMYESEDRETSSDTDENKSDATD